MNHFHTPPADRWTIIFDGDDTLWICNEYYNAAASVCERFIAMEFPDLHGCGPELRHHCRQIQHSLIRKYGYYLELYEDAWVEVYLQLCHRARRTPSPLISGAIFQAARGVHDGPYSVMVGVREMLDQLYQAGHQPHLLTLGDEDWQRAKVRRNNLEKYFTSIHVIRRTKGPQLRLLAGNPARTMMVGDSRQRDILPALRLQISAVWIHPPDDAKDPPERHDFSQVYRLPKVVGLPALLQRLNSQPPAS